MDCLTCMLARLRVPTATTSRRLIIGLRKQQCYSTTTSLSQRKITPVQRPSCGEPWTPEEEEMLVNLKRNGQTFREISAVMPGRTRDQLVRRYYRAMREANADHIVPARKWSSRETRLLLDLRANQDLPWDEVTRHFPTRTRLALHLMYQKLLDEGAKSSRELWSEAEDRILLRSRNEEQKSWSETAACLPGRSIDSAKFRFQEIDPVTPLVYTSARNIPRDKIDRATQLRGEGNSWKRVAELLGDVWSPTALYDSCRAAERFPDGVPTRHKWTAEEDAKLLALVEQDQTWDRVEEVLGRTRRAARSRLYGLNRSAMASNTSFPHKGKSFKGETREVDQIG